MNELIKKTDSLLMDRLALKDEVEGNLLAFINLTIQKLTSEDSLKKQVLETLANRLQEPDFTDAALLKLLEILSKQDNEITMSIIDIVKNKTNTTNDVPVVNNAPESESNFTKEDVADVKSLLKKLEDVKKAEF